MELEVGLDEQLVAAVERAKRDGDVGAARPNEALHFRANRQFSAARRLAGDHERDRAKQRHAFHRRNSRTIRLNSSAFSSCGMCPQLSMITFFAPGIVRSSRSALAGFASSSYLPHTINVGALTPRTCSSVRPPRSPASCILVIVNPERSRITSCSSTIFSVTRLLSWNKILKNSRVSSRVVLFCSCRRRSASDVIGAGGAAFAARKPPPSASTI